MLLQILLAAVAQASPQPAASPAPPPFVTAAPASTLNVEDLGTIRGGDGAAVSLTEQALSAINGSRIQAGAVASGAIAVTTGAFANFDGLGNIVMNTGHANNIQSTLSVTVTMSPAPIP